MKMYVIDNGKMWLDSSGLLVETAEATDGSPPKGDWVDIPVCTFLIDHPDGLVLFDTACDPEGMSKNWPEYNKQVSPHEATEDEYLPARLEQLNIIPEDIDFVIMSHLHTDHAGCLKLFKNARVFVNAAEFKETLAQYGLRDYKPAYIASDIMGWLGAELSFQLIAPHITEYDFLPGLTIVNFGPGHAFGMMGLLVRLEESGNFLIVSDALYTKENMGPPVRLAGLVYDAEGYVKTAEFIREYAAAHHATILFGHDKVQFEGLVKSTEGHYA